MSKMVEVKTADLIRRALDWAVAKAERLPLCEEACYGVHILIGTGRGDLECYSHSTDWAQGGPLIERYGVLLSPPQSPVHLNFGPYDSRNGYCESGVWSATIFRQERKHRRASFSHPTEPLVAAMRAIVQFELGDVVSVPAELDGQP